MYNKWLYNVSTLLYVKFNVEFCMNPHYDTYFIIQRVMVERIELLLLYYCCYLATFKANVQKITK